MIEVGQNDGIKLLIKGEIGDIPEISFKGKSFQENQNETDIRQ